MGGTAHLACNVIGYWSEIKLDIVKDYAAAYSTILAAQKKPSLCHVNIDAFAGAGVHVSKTTGEYVPGSHANALLVQPLFREYHLIDIDRQKVALLERRQTAAWSQTGSAQPNNPPHRTIEPESTNSASASQGCLAVQHCQQRIVIVHEIPFVAPASSIPGLPILAHAISATPLIRPLGEGPEHREKHLIRLFNPP